MYPGHATGGHLIGLSAGRGRADDVVIQDLGGSLLIRYMTLVAKFTEKGACHTGGVGPHRFLSVEKFEGPKWCEVLRAS